MYIIVTTYSRVFYIQAFLFSNKSVQSSSCERPKTTQRTLFLLFANNNCFPTSNTKLLALSEFRKFFYITDTDHCNDAKVTSTMLPISVRYLCQNSQRRTDLSLCLNRFTMISRFLPFSQISGRMYLQYRCFN
jgi:hypothetical protein